MSKRITPAQRAERSLIIPGDGSGIQYSDDLSTSLGACAQPLDHLRLHNKLVRHQIDVRRTQTYTRNDLAERIGGSPAAMGWESPGVMLEPQDLLASLDLAATDHQVVQRLSLLSV